MQATIDIRLFNSAKMKEHKFNRFLEIVQEELKVNFLRLLLE